MAVFLHDFRRKGKGLSYTVRIQTGLYISIFIHVEIVIEVDKATVLEGPKGDNREYRQSQANQDRNQVLLLGCF